MLLFLLFQLLPWESNLKFKCAKDNFAAISVSIGFEQFEKKRAENMMLQEQQQQ